MNIRLYVHHSRTLSSLLIAIITLFLLIPYSLLAAEADLKISEKGIFQEVGSGRMWQTDRSKKLKTAGEVDAYLKELNTGKYNDWRLPTKQELFELFSIFDLKNNGEVKIRLEGNYWLIDKESEVQVGAWEIGDQCGPSLTYYPKKAGYVKAVRP